MKYNAVIRWLGCGIMAAVLLVGPLFLVREGMSGKAGATERGCLRKGAVALIWERIPLRKMFRYV